MQRTRRRAAMARAIGGLAVGGVLLLFGAAFALGEVTLDDDGAIGCGHHALDLASGRARATGEPSFVAACEDVAREDLVVGWALAATGAALSGRALMVPRWTRGVLAEQRAAAEQLRWTNRRSVRRSPIALGVPALLVTAAFGAFVPGPAPLAAAAILLLAIVATTVALGAAAITVTDAGVVVRDRLLRRRTIPHREIELILVDSTGLAIWTERGVTSTGVLGFGWHVVGELAAERAARDLAKEVLVRSGRPAEDADVLVGIERLDPEAEGVPVDHDHQDDLVARG